VPSDHSVQCEVYLAGLKRCHLTRGCTFELCLKATDSSRGNPEPPRYLGGLLTFPASPGDQEGAVDWAHAKTCYVLDQKLLNFLILRKTVVNNDRRDLVDP
jgi:hypothetical protein